MSPNHSHPFLFPDFEPQRLEALRPYQVLNVAGEDLCSTLVAIVARLFNTPVALLSLVQAEEVQFLANTGLEGVTSVPRPDSLCSVAILQHGITHYEDLLLRPCHLTNPTAAEQLNLRFYAGSALRTAEGLPIGALCIMDRTPRRFSLPERHLLDSLADVAMSLLDLRAAQPADSDALKRLRETLHERLSLSLDRIGALAELGEWEDADSEAAVAYQHASLEEAAYLTRLMQQELRESLQRLAA